MVGEVDFECDVACVDNKLIPCLVIFFGWMSDNPSFLFSPVAGSLAIVADSSAKSGKKILQIPGTIFFNDKREVSAADTSGTSATNENIVLFDPNKTPAVASMRESLNLNTRQPKCSDLCTEG